LWPPFGSAEWARPNGIATLLAGAGVVGYVLLRVATSRFYGPLGVSPEDVGIAYPTVLAQAALGVAFVVCSTLFAGGALWGLGLLRQRSRALWAGALAAILVLAFVGLAWILPATAPWLAPSYALVLFLLLILGGPLVAQVAEIESGARGTADRKPDAFRLWLPLLGFGVVIAFSLLFLTARFDARHVVGEGDAANDQIAGVTVFPWQATVAVVHWSGALPAGIEAEQLTCVLYLGRSSDGAVIFTSHADGSRSLVKVSGDQAVVELYPDVESCKWRKPKRPPVLHSTT
jgi:hypothetical protein